MADSIVSGKLVPVSALQIFNARRKLPFIPTMSAKLNKILGGGLRAEGTYVCCGGPGAGKTTFSLNIADYIISQPQPYTTIYVSAELPPDLVLDRLASKRFNMSWLDVVDMEAEDKLEKYRQLAESIDHNFWVIGPEQASHYVKWIKQIREGLNQNAGTVVPVLIIIDYIQDLAQTRTGAGKDARAAVTELSREVRFFAQDQFCPVWAISSTGRQFYNSDEEVSDASLIASAKESGEIEYNVNAVIYLRRKDVGDKPYIQAIVAKNRFGENPAQVIFESNPVTGSVVETGLDNKSLGSAGAFMKTYTAIQQKPAFYEKAEQIAKTTKCSVTETKEALAMLINGMGLYKICVFPGHTGYSIIPIDEAKVLPS